MNTMKKYIVLRGLKQGNTFYTSYNGESEDKAVRLKNGVIVYEIVGYADTSEEALKLIDKSYIDHGTTSERELRNYIQNIVSKLNLDGLHASIIVDQTMDLTENYETEQKNEQ